MKSFIRNVAFVSIPALLLILVILELLFRFVIPACEPPFSRFDQEHRMLLYDRDLAEEGVYTVGKLAQQRGRWRINNYGWKSPINYQTEKSKTRIAVIGDSYVEAIQLDNDKSVSSLLGQALSDTAEVYSFGISGASLSHYLHIYRYALRLFDPDIIIVNVVHNDFDESVHNIRPDQKHVPTLNIQGSQVEERPPAPYTASTFNRLIRKCALARYLYLNLKVHRVIRSLRRTDAKMVYAANIDVADVEKRTELIQTAVSYIIGRFKAESEGKRLLFVMDAPRLDIYEGRIERSRELFLHTMLAEACREAASSSWT